MTQHRTPIDYIHRLPEAGGLAKAIATVVRKKQEMLDIATQIALIEREVEAEARRLWSEEEINTAKREQRDADEAEDIAANDPKAPARLVAMRALDEAGQCVALATEAVQELCR